MKFIMDDSSSSSTALTVTSANRNMLGATNNNNKKLPSSVLSNTSGNSCGKPNETKLQMLKQKKIDLGKKLDDKKNLLEQLCLQEAQLLAIYSIEYNNSNDNESKIENNLNANNIVDATLRTKVGTCFNVPDTLNSFKYDDINKLLLTKNIQQQIADASVKLINDTTVSKSLRRAHKQNYDIAQQKLAIINYNIFQLEKQQQIAVPVLSSATDDINGNRTMQLPNIAIQNHYNSVERRNSILSTNSEQHLSQPSPNNRQMLEQKNSRSRHHKNDMTQNTEFKPISQLVTASTQPHNGHIQQYYQSQFVPHNNQKNKLINHQVPNTVPSSKNVGNENISMSSINANPMGNSREFIASSQILKTQNMHPQYQHNQYYSTNENGKSLQNELISPQNIGELNKVEHYYVKNQQESKPNSITNDFHIERENCYALPTTRHNKMKTKKHQPEFNHETVAIDFAKESEIIPNVMVHQQQGLGGYWLQLSSNDKVWCTYDRYASLDRKDQRNVNNKNSYVNSSMVKPITDINNKTSMQPAKSTSLGNFEFLRKADDISTSSVDSISLSSANSENRKLQKERQWTETSLDGPINKYKPMVASQILPRQNIRSTSSPQEPSHLNMQVSPREAVSGDISQYHTLPAISQHYQQKLSHDMHTTHGHHSGSIPYTLKPDKMQYVPNEQGSFDVINLDRNVMGSAAILSHGDTITNQNYPIIYTDERCYSAMQSPKHHQSVSLIPNSPNLHFLKETDFIMKETPTGTLNTKHIDNHIQHQTPVYNSHTMVSPQGPKTNMRIESPLNVTVIQEAKFQPYKEVVKPFEMSDFYKYSTKYRQRNSADVNTKPQQQQSYEAVE